MCGDAITAPWEAPGVRAEPAHPAPAAVPPASRRSRKPAELSAGALLAFVLLAMIPAHGGDAPGRPTLGEGPAASSSARPAVAGTYLLGSLKTSSLAVQVAELQAVQLSSLPASQVPPSIAGLTIGDSEVSGAASERTAEGQGTAETRAANTAKPAPIRPALVSAATPGPAPRPLATPQLYKKDLYDGSLVRYQNPDMTACTATATQMMLNFTASKGSADQGFAWTPTTSYSTQEAILSWERANDTLASPAPGSDPHGWRNALNYYGWHDFTNPGSRHYEDLAYSSYSSAVKAAVVAIATENQPVGILGWAGGHAQIMTGYEVYGGDPATSSDFTVEAIYLTDPLAGDRIRDMRIAYSAFGSGPTVYRFQPYTWKDSPGDDPYMPGTTPSYVEWYGKWVIVAPVGVSSASPGPAS